MLRDTRGAADYLGKVRGQPGVSAFRLKQLRTEGGGPRYRKVGRFVVYEEEELDRWADARLSPPRLSTTQTAEA
jgi:hypothetical protein